MSTEPVDHIYREHNVWLKGWLRRRIGMTAEAEDLAHDAFVRLIVSDQAARLDEPRAFLTTLSRGLVANFWRRKAIEEAYLQALAAQPQNLAPSPEQQTLVLQALYEVDQMLNRIPAKARRAFILSRLEGLSQEEIAAELGVSDRMVRKYLAQAMLVCVMEKAGVSTA